MSKPLKVAAFRAEADHLFRLANVDYHACVGAHELDNWRAVAGRVLAEVEHCECKRATPYDLEQFRKAVEAVKERITQAVERGQAKAANDSLFSG